MGGGSKAIQSAGESISSELCRSDCTIMHSRRLVGSVRPIIGSHRLARRQLSSCPRSSCQILNRQYFVTQQPDRDDLGATQPCCPFRLLPLPWWCRAGSRSLGLPTKHLPRWFRSASPSLLAAAEATAAAATAAGKRWEQQQQPSLPCALYRTSTPPSGLRRQNRPPRPGPGRGRFTKGVRHAVD